MHMIFFLNFLPNDKILDWSKLKTFADDKMKYAKMMIVVFDRVENLVGKGENAGYQHFLLFPQCFPKASASAPREHFTIFLFLQNSNLEGVHITVYRYLAIYCEANCHVVQ